MQARAKLQGRRAGRRLALGAVVCFILWPAVSAGHMADEAQAAKPASALPQNAATPKTKRFELGVELRLRNEIRDNADFTAADDFDHFLGYRLRLHLRAELHPDLTAYVQAQDVWLFDARGDKVIHDLATNLHQAYFDWKPAGSERWSLRVGRQELIYGEERLVGAFGWDNVGRSFDGLRLRFLQGAWSSDFFSSRQVDVRRAGARRRAGFQDLHGGYFTRAPRDAVTRTEFYGLFLRDGLRSAGELNRAAESTRLFTAGLRRVHQPKTGWRYSAEHAWQFGFRGPDAHRAAMLVATGGYAWGGRRQPRLQVEYSFATGDRDPRDGRSREFHNLFPTNHIFYGYADLAGLRNLHDFRLTAAAALHPKLLVEADYHRFLLAAKRGPWRNAGGRVLGFDATGAAGRDLGQEWDLTVRLPAHKRINLMGGYSILLPGAFARRTRGPENHHFGYLQTTLRF